MTTLVTEPANVHHLPAGLFFIEQGHNVIVVIEHQGIKVVLQYDNRGPACDHYYSIVTIEWHGEECTFNEIDDACRWIDCELGLDVEYKFDPSAEWGVLDR